MSTITTTKCKIFFAALSVDSRMNNIYNKSRISIKYCLVVQKDMICLSHEGLPCPVTGNTGALPGDIWYKEKMGYY